MAKDEVRALARRAGLPNADKPDSQEICFIPDGDHVGFVTAHGGAGAAGTIVDDTSGAPIGKHEGTHAFTVGQRRGVPGGGAGPRFVLRIDAATGEVRVGPRDRLGRDQLRVADVRWLDPRAAEARAPLRRPDPPPRRRRARLDRPRRRRRDAGPPRRARLRRGPRSGRRVLRPRRPRHRRRLDPVAANELGASVGFLDGWRSKFRNALSRPALYLYQRK